MADQQRKHQEFKLTEKHQKAFNLQKSHLMSVPVLHCPDFNRPVDVGTYKSLQGLEAVLSQWDENGMGSAQLMQVDPCNPLNRP